MPTYDYECSACGHEMEVFQSMKDDPLKRCPACGKSKLHRKIGTGAGLIFKGGGFYETDYKRAGSGKDSGAGKDGGGSGEAKEGGSSSSEGSGKDASKKSGGTNAAASGSKAAGGSSGAESSS